MQKPVRLTLKTAKALVKQELGLSGAQLATVNAGNGVYIYKMMLGRFEVYVENDWNQHNGLFRINFTSCRGEGMMMYYNPVTLEEDCEAGDKHRAAVRNEHCEGCTLYQAAHIKS